MFAHLTLNPFGYGHASKSRDVFGATSRRREEPVTCHRGFLHIESEPGPHEDGQMKRARFTEEQIIGILREHEAGAKAADLAR